MTWQRVSLLKFLFRLHLPLHISVERLFCLFHFKYWYSFCFFCDFLDSSSPIGTYKQLIDWYNKGDLDFSEIRSVNLDEYKGLDASNPQSYAYFMRHNLFDSVNIKLENTMQARSILLIASGEAKAEAMYQALFGPITPTVPASILQLHNNVSIVADEAALSLIIQKNLI